MLIKDKAHFKNNAKTDYYSVYHRLGRCYYFEHGVEEDKKKAYDLIYEAMRDDYDPAKIFYEEFLKNKYMI